MTTTITRRRAVGEKKPWEATAESASRFVTRVRNVCTGGGRSIPIDFSRVAPNTSASALGKRCGSVRSVTEASPTGTDGTAALDRARDRLGPRDPLR